MKRFRYGLMALIAVMALTILSVGAVSADGGKKSKDDGVKQEQNAANVASSHQEAFPLSGDAKAKAFGSFFKVEAKTGDAEVKQDSDIKQEIKQKQEVKKSCDCKKDRKKHKKWGR